MNKNIELKEKLLEKYYEQSSIFNNGKTMHDNEHDNSGDIGPYHNNSHDNTPGFNKLIQKKLVIKKK